MPVIYLHAIKHLAVVTGILDAELQQDITLSGTLSIN